MLFFFNHLFYIELMLSYVLWIQIMEKPQHNTRCTEAFYQ